VVGILAQVGTRARSIAIEPGKGGERRNLGESVEWNLGRIGGFLRDVAVADRG